MCIEDRRTGQPIRMSTLSPKYDDPFDRADDATFLHAQFGRLLGRFPDKRLTPTHRKGLWLLLWTLYPECWATVVERNIPEASACRLARYYVRALQPSFRAFATVTTRAAACSPPTQALAQRLYRSILPIVQGAFRAVRALDLGSAGYTTEEEAGELVTALTPGVEARFRELLEVEVRRGVLKRDLILTRDLVLDGKNLVSASEAARRLIAGLVHLPPKSPRQRQRDLRPQASPSWRVPEWETPEAAALAEQLSLLPS